jgi:hypothetical protein
MSTLVLTNRMELSPAPATTMKFAAQFWFVVAVLGQWMFAFYVAAVYSPAAVRGNLAAWNKGMSHRYIAGDSAGNFAMALHLLLAFIVTVGGPLQLIPQLRKWAPGFHRWNGRLYILAVFATSMAGLYMVWVRGTVGDFVQHVGVSLDGILIMTFAVLALRTALARDLRAHRRWALRLFLVVSGVWFYRVGLMVWLVINRGPAGFDPKTFVGPFLSFWSFANYLLPLAVLELYLRAGESHHVGRRFAMAAGLLVLTLAMAIGIVVATKVMWLPRIEAAGIQRIPHVDAGDARSLDLKSRSNSEGLMS